MICANSSNKLIYNHYCTCHCQIKDLAHKMHCN